MTDWFDKAAFSFAFLFLFIPGVFGPFIGPFTLFESMKAFAGFIVFTYLIFRE